MNTSLYCITLFGIPNCDTVKKARVWLDEHHITYTFHNFKKEGLNQKMVQDWLEHLTLDEIINKKGSTWRGLDDHQKTIATLKDDAIALIGAHPSLVKRPVLHIMTNSSTHNQRYHLGFQAEQYQNIFSQL